MKLFILFIAFIFPLASNAQTTALSADDVQILFVEMQTGFISQSRTENPKRIAEAALALAKSAKVLGIPITFSIVPFNGKHQDVIPELRSFASDKNTFTRTITAPLLDPKIAKALSTNGRKTLIVAGFAAEVAVLQTTLDAVRASYLIQIPVDAVGSISERTETAAFAQMEKEGATLTSVLSLVMRLAPDIAHPPGTLTFDALKPVLKPAK